MSNSPFSVAVGDFNRDGKLDLAAANFNSNNVSVLLNTTPTVTVAALSAPSEAGPTNGTFTITLDKPAPAGGLTVNFTTAGTATYTTDYSFSAGTNITAVTANSFTIEAGQTTATLNVVPVPDSVVESGGKTVQINLSAGGDYILGPSAGAGIQLSTASNFAVGNSPQSVAVGDFNGDGKLDFAAANFNSNSVTVRLGDGTGKGFTTTSTFTVGTNPSSVAVGDFNGDGKLDLAAANFSGNSVSVLLNQPSATLTIADANPPIIATNAGLTVAEGASDKTIASTALQVTDIEQSGSEMTYTLTAVPGNGTLFNKGTQLAVGGTFTQADIDASKLTYTHKVGETTSDSFTFAVSDGAGGEYHCNKFQYYCYAGKRRANPNRHPSHPDRH